MKRHSSLQPLSREHHLALLCWRRLDQQLAGEDELLLDAARELVQYLNSRFVQHMRDEEGGLLPLLNEELAEKLIRDHCRLERLLDQNQHLNTQDLCTERRRNLSELANALRTHIRWEERIMFPYLQEHLTETALGLLAEALDPTAPHAPPGGAANRGSQQEEGRDE